MERKHKIEKVLHSMDSSLPIEPNPYLYEKVVARLNAKKASSGGFILRPVLMMVVVLALNVFTVYFYMNNGKNGSSVDEDFAKEYFDNEYQFEKL